MRNIGERAKLSFETIDVRGLCAGQNFERDDLVHLAVMRFVHDAHAARAQPAGQGETIRTGKFFDSFSHVGNSINGQNRRSLEFGPSNANYLRATSRWLSFTYPGNTAGQGII